MPTITFVSEEGQQFSVEASEGMTVMDAGVRNVVPGMYGLCGGALACVTCHVYVSGDDAGVCGVPSDFESDMLEATVSPRQINSRLSCQIPVIEGIDAVSFGIPPKEF